MEKANGREISRSEAYKHAAEQLGRDYNYDKYIVTYNHDEMI